MIISFRGLNMNREIIARWLMSKLLGAFFVSVLIFWIFPKLQIDWTNMSFYEFYGWVVGVLSLAGFISYLLITPPKIFKRKEIVEVEGKEKEVS